MRSLLIATRNKGKAREFAELLGEGWRVRTLLDEPALPEVIEDGRTFEHNATKKAVEISRLVPDYVLADDSGLEVDALQGAPGVDSALYAGTHGADAANNEKLLREMTGVPESHRGAHFRCVLVLAHQGQVLHQTEGLCFGRIATECSGNGGFGYDCLFIPDRHERTFGELPSEVKHQISHRAKALRKMVTFCTESLGSTPPPSVQSQPPRLLRSGKVRDLYSWGEELWLVASDRISAFDVVMPTPIPSKGRLLTAMSRFWFERFAHLVPNHILSYDLPPEVDCPEFQGRLMRARRCEVIPLECVARGYLAGSGWAEYREHGTVGGIPVPGGLCEAEELPEPLFTPARKNDHGHDENLTPDEARAWVGADRYEELKQLTLLLYREAQQYAAQRGILIADTKFEFGLYNGRVTLIDEVLTPDSSRFWPQATYERGRSQASFDKQYLRDYLAGLDWNRQPPAPELPPRVVEQTIAKYEEALRLLTAP